MRSVFLQKIISRAAEVAEVSEEELRHSRSADATTARRAVIGCLVSTFSEKDIAKAFGITRQAVNTAKNGTHQESSYLYKIVRKETERELQKLCNEP